MALTRGSYTHPVLYELEKLNNNYNSSSLNTKTEILFYSSLTEIGLTVSVNLNDDYINSLIEEKFAKCSLIVECDKTYFHESWDCDVKNKSKILIKDAKIIGNMKVVFIKWYLSHLILSSKIVHLLH